MRNNWSSMWDAVLLTRRWRSEERIWRAVGSFWGVWVRYRPGEMKRGMRGRKMEWEVVYEPEETSHRQQAARERELGVINKLEDMKSDRHFMRNRVNHRQDTLDLSFLSLAQFSPLMAICQTARPLRFPSLQIYSHWRSTSNTHTYIHTECPRCGTMPAEEAQPPGSRWHQAERSHKLSKQQIRLWKRHMLLMLKEDKERIKKRQTVNTALKSLT